MPVVVLGAVDLPRDSILLPVEVAALGAGEMPVVGGAVVPDLAVNTRFLALESAGLTEGSMPPPGHALKTSLRRAL